MSTTNNASAQSSSPPIGYLLRKLDGLITERFEHTLGRYGITRRQWQLLNTLVRGNASYDALNSAIAPFLDQAAGETVAEHLSPLVDAGVIIIRDDEYELTERGREDHKRLLLEVETTRALTVEGITPSAYEHTRQTLQSMVRNLEQAS